MHDEPSPSMPEEPQTQPQPASSAPEAIPAMYPPIIAQLCAAVKELAGQVLIEGLASAKAYNDFKSRFPDVMA